MSETVTIGGSYTAQIYGTFAAGTAYIQTKFGDAYTAWLALTTDNQKRTFATAAAYLDRQGWNDSYDTFAERDALEAFQLASYELGALIAADPDIVTTADQGSNIQSADAGGAGVTFFNPTSKGRGASLLPPILDALIGEYLAAQAASVYGGSGATGSEDSPFDDCSDYDRNGGW